MITTHPPKSFSANFGFPSALKPSVSDPNDQLPADAFQYSRSVANRPAVKFGLQDPYQPRSEHVLSPVRKQSLAELEKLNTAIQNIPRGVYLFNHPVYIIKNNGFFADQKVTTNLNQYLNNIQTNLPPGTSLEEIQIPSVQIDNKTFQKLQRQKYQVSRLYDRLVSGYSSPSKEQTREATAQFMKQLSIEYAKSVLVFRLRDYGGDAINSLDDQHLEVYRAIVARTAPLIFNMGFLDGIPHAGQVSRLSANQMRRFYRGQEDSTQLSMLQAAIVGWLHDCKLDGKTSWDNLSSHPMISSAVAWAVSWHVLHEPSIQDLLRDNLHLNEKQRDQFVQQIVEAISINNDSYFVLQHAIFGKKDGAGISGQMIKAGYSEAATAHLENWANDRFWAPSKSSSTDLNGVKPPLLDEYCEKNQVPEPIKLEMQDALDNLKIGTGLYDKKRQEIRVPIKYLFSHHDDVSPSARLLALCLVFADNLLLSPNKTVPVNPGTPLDKITVYLNSLEKNFACLPEDVRNFQQPFRRAILLSMLQASDQHRRNLAETQGINLEADAMSENPPNRNDRGFLSSVDGVVSKDSLYNQFMLATEGTAASRQQVLDDNERLMVILKAKETWGERWCDEEIDTTQDTAFKELITTFDKRYEKMRSAYADVAMENNDTERQQFKMPAFSMT